MAELQYYILDVESTGLKLGYHEITQISVLRYSDKTQMTKFIRPEYPERTSQQALDATGRTRADLYKGEPKEVVVAAIDAFIVQDKLTPEHRVCVGHSIGFDKNFCQTLWARLGKKFPMSLFLDTKTLAKMWAKQLGIEKPRLTLEASLSNAGLKPLDMNFHDAAADARNCYLLLKKGIDYGLDHLSLVKRSPHYLE